VAGPVDPDLVADDENGQKRENPDPFGNHAKTLPVSSNRLHDRAPSVKPARRPRLIPAAFDD
jgi:hypothetical protein